MKRLALIRNSETTHLLHSASKKACHVRFLFATICVLLTMTGSATNGGILSSNSLVDVELEFGPIHLPPIEKPGAASVSRTFSFSDPLQPGIHSEATGQAFTGLDASSFVHAGVSISTNSVAAAKADAYWRDVAYGPTLPFIRLGFRVEAQLYESGAIPIAPYIVVRTATIPTVDPWYSAFIFSTAGEADLYGQFFSPNEELKVLGFDSALVETNVGQGSSATISAIFHIDAPYRADLGGYYWALQLETYTGSTSGIVDVSSLHSVSLQSVSDPDGNPLDVTFDSGLSFAAEAVPEPSTFVMSSILFGVFGVAWAVKKGRSSITYPTQPGSPTVGEQ